MQAFQIDILNRTKRVTAVWLLKEMGYQKPARKQVDRLNKVILDPDLGLGSSDYDFKYSNEEFLKHLCGALGINAKYAEANINSIKNRQLAEYEVFKPYLYVDTDFKRECQPVFVLGLFSHQRFIELPTDAWEAALEEKIAVSNKIIKEHLEVTQGELGIWGSIKRYWLFIDKEHSFQIDLDLNVDSRPLTRTPPVIKLRPEINQIINLH